VQYSTTVLPFRAPFNFAQMGCTNIKGVGK